MSEAAKPRPVVAVGAAIGVVVGLVLTVAAVVLGETTTEGEVLVASARMPSAMAATPDGGLVYGERLSGRIRRVDAEGELEPDDVAEVDTDGEEGQRGLVGVAVDGDRVYAAWTRAGGDRRLVVAQVAPGEERILWEGGASVEQSNGGHLELIGGDLLLGVGDLIERERLDDEEETGKLLVLDPDGEADQEPRVLSEGWNNPFSFTVTPDGAVWVADNAPPSRRERIARGDEGGEPSSVTELERPDTAPSGVVALSEDRLAVCGYVSEEIRVYDVGGDGAVEDEGERIEGCTLGVELLADGRLAYAEEDTIRTIEVP